MLPGYCIPPLSLHYQAQYGAYNLFRSSLQWEELSRHVLPRNPKVKFQNQIIHRSGPAQNLQCALIPDQIKLGIVPCGTTTYLP